jgi:4-amino-4-deoxy-L-arabinose transferase-like glycosyltransferase
MSPHGKRLGLLLLAMAGVYLAGNGRTQLFDRDEPRYAQCSRQMLQTGDWIVPRLYDNIRAAKPPGIYWCQATAMKLLGDNAFAARLPSAIAAIFTALLLALWAWREAGTRHAVWSAFVLASSLLMLFAGKSSMTDVVLLLFIAVSMGSIYFLWRGRGGWPAVIALSVAIACGGLVKGPFILGVLATTIIVLALLSAFDRWRGSINECYFKLARGFLPLPPGEGRGEGKSEESSISKKRRPQFPLTLTLSRRERKLKVCSSRVNPAISSRDVQLSAPPSIPTRQSHLLRALIQIIVGLAIIAALVLPWIWLVHRRAPEFLGAAQADAMHHLETGAEGHKAYLPFYHFFLIWFTFLPWSVLLPLTMVLAFKNRQDPPIRFAFAALLGSWIFAEALRTKLPHYMLPGFPPLAFLTADAIIRCLDGRQRDLETKVMRIAARILAGAILVLSIAPWWWLAFRFHSYPWIALIAMTAGGALYAFLVCYFFDTGRVRAALISMGSGSMGLAVLLFALCLPNSQPLRLPPRVADVLIAHGVTHPHQALMFEYKEPSLAFYQGGTIREYDSSLAQLAISPGEPRWVVIPKWVWDQATPATKNAFELIGPPLKGLDYSDALKTADVMVLRRR